MNRYIYIYYIEQYSFNIWSLEGQKDHLTRVILPDLAKLLFSFGPGVCFLSIYYENIRDNTETYTEISGINTKKLSGIRVCVWEWIPEC